MPPSSSSSFPPDLLRHVVTQMFSSITTDSDVNTFFLMHLGSFEGNCEVGDEHDLKWMDIYGDFEKLMERKMTAIAESLGFDMEDSGHSFYDKLREIVDKNATVDKKEQRMMDLLISSYDYEKFVALMRVKAKRRREEEKTAEREEPGGEEKSYDSEEEKVEDCSEMFYDDSDD